MFSFCNDYSECAHSSILEAISACGVEQNPGYGMDLHSRRAADLIRNAIECPTADIHFLAGGTITNQTFLSHILRPYEAVISTPLGHINTHETGAIEHTGHKVIEINTANDKLTPEDILPVLQMHNDEHWVLPRVVYISNTTELGTIYTRNELQSLYEFCHSQNLYLYVDGARLAMALASPASDIRLKDLPSLCDAFYIGGTKNGALFGEALVLINDSLKPHFRHSMKNNAAMTAKGFLIGIQFEALFTNDLYLKLGAHADQTSCKLRTYFQECGYPELLPSQSNQTFVILPNTLLEHLNQNWSYEIWNYPDPGHTCVRFVTSWSTPMEQVEQFGRELKKLHEIFQ